MKGLKKEVFRETRCLVPALAQHDPKEQDIVESLVNESLALAQHSIPVTNEQVEISQGTLKSDLPDTP